MTYQLSSEAKQDLDDLFEFGFERFGFDQAEKYLAEIEALIEDLVSLNHLGRERKDLVAGLRCIPYKSHLIFYSIERDKILIVRVLHGSVDLPTYLIIDF